jgi:hypothetical protein
MALSSPVHDGRAWFGSRRIPLPLNPNLGTISRRCRPKATNPPIGYASVALEISRSVPDEFRKLAEKDL